ncbi:hypothetical protein H5410_061756 [Solanum commersonii]|uniref:Uncharacterized protein n=1 Tax=Solanum commersonii TaxID=4109 RepID=A0A9J5WAK1_SOLCO|nr:hypothetical protein H5410_061756 [Solanum commersonii]
MLSAIGLSPSRCKDSKPLSSTTLVLLSHNPIFTFERLPYSGISGSMLIFNSLKHFIDYYALPRLWVPRSNHQIGKIGCYHKALYRLSSQVGYKQTRTADIRRREKKFTTHGPSTSTRHCSVRLSPIAENSPLLPPVGVWAVSQSHIRPGLTTATQYSGDPFPEPIRVSAGLSVTGLSGNICTHIFPPRRAFRVIARRPASICRDVIQAGLTRDFSDLRMHELISRCYKDMTYISYLDWFFRSR